MDVDARLEALEEENLRLRDEIDRLRTDRGYHIVAPPEWRLTRKEALVFAALSSGRPQSKEQIMDAIYEPGADDEPQIKIIDVFICKLRKKLAPYSLKVVTLWGHGYQLEAASKALYDQTWANAA